jgi:hypothetical protein
VAIQFVLEQEEFEALISFARAGAAAQSADRVRQLDAYLKMIEKKNGITRYVVWVQWQEVDSPLPAGTNFPETWPPEMRKKIELVTRPVARVDVDQVLEQYARQPENILCTKDPAGVLGYTPIDSFFTN